MIFINDEFGLVFLTILGCVSGFSAGLLGIGGGLVTVPALIFALPHFGVSGPEIPKIAMATSLALIVPTSIASTQTHAARGAVDWPMLVTLAPSIVAGAFLASVLAPAFNAHLVVLIFVTFAVVTAWRLIHGNETRPEQTCGAGTPPDPLSIAVKGVAGGGLAAAMGIGGAFFIIPILVRFISMQRAIGTASALAIPLSLAGGAGYILAEAPAGCQQGCVGYVFFPAVAAAGISAVLAAPFGAWLTQHSPVVALRRLFALFLICAAGNLAYKSIYPATMANEARRVIAIIGSLVEEQPLISSN